MQTEQGTPGWQTAAALARHSYGSAAHCFTRCTAPSRCRIPAAANQNESDSDAPPKRLARQAAGASRRARDARDDEWAALLEESRASDPRLAGRPAPRVERFTYGVDGADDRTMTFYGAAFTAADAAPRPGVVLFHTAAGPRDRFVEWMAERLVAAGYTAVVADLYGDAWGSGWDAAWAAGPREALKDPAVLAERALAALRCAQARPDVDAGRCGALGWCLGGRAAVTLASMRPAGLRAAVSFHGVFDAECLERRSRRTSRRRGCSCATGSRTRSCRPSTPRWRRSWSGACRRSRAASRSRSTASRTRPRRSIRRTRSPTTPSPRRRRGGGPRRSAAAVCDLNAFRHIMDNRTFFLDISRATHARPDPSRSDASRGASTPARSGAQHGGAAARSVRKRACPRATPVIAEMNNSTA